DHYLSKPWDPPEEYLFPVIDDLLDAWQAEYLPEAKGLRLVGHQWSPRSHEIKDFLAGNLIPYRWLDVARNPDTRSLLDAAGIGAARRDAGAAAWRGVARAARGDWGVHRCGIQAPDAQRWPRDCHADHAGRDRHGVPRASCAGRGGPYGRGGVLRGGYDGGAGVQRPACSRCRRWELGGTSGYVSGALRKGRADRGAPRILSRHHVAVPHRADRKDAEHTAQSPDGTRTCRRERPRGTRRAQAGRWRESGGGNRRGVRVHWHQAAKRLAPRRRTA